MGTGPGSRPSNVNEYLEREKERDVEEGLERRVRESEAAHTRPALRARSAWSRWFKRRRPAD